MKKNDLLQQLNAWYKKPLGKILAATEKKELQQILPNLFGYKIIQVGVPEEHQWLEISPIAHKIYINRFDACHSVSILAEHDILPFKENSIDVVLLPHTLECIENPKKLLKEIERVLIPEGHIIILGFNRNSLWGLRHFFRRRKKQHAPWAATFYSFQKMRRHLNEINCDIQILKSFFYRPPINNKKILKKLLWLETLGKLCWPYPGGVYLIVAKKQVTTLTPISLGGRLRRLFVADKRRVQQPTS